MRDNPDLKLSCSAKHGLIVWGDTAEEAYRKTIEVINQAVAFVNERDAATSPRFGGRKARAGRVADASCCRRSAARSPPSARRC